MIDRRFLTPLAAARLDLSALVEQRAPRDVIKAAERAVFAVEERRSVDPASQAILIQHAARQQRQNRYGK